MFCVALAMFGIGALEASRPDKRGVGFVAMAIAVVLGLTALGALRKPGSGG